MESSPLTPLTPVAPVRPVAPYVGGKRNLSRRLVELIAATPHDAYLLTSRVEFERLSRTDPATLTDLERAARFLYLQRTAFGGKVEEQHFGLTRTNPARFDVTKLQPLLEAVHERLAGVVIERLGYGEFITRYDRPGALFFLDPPYWGNENDYGRGLFCRADFGVLRGLLEALKGRFILTLNDRPETRALFAGFDLEPVGLTYRLSGAPTEGRELIITGGGAG